MASTVLSNEEFSFSRHALARLVDRGFCEHDVYEAAADGGASCGPAAGVRSAAVTASASFSVAMALSCPCCRGAHGRSATSVRAPDRTVTAAASMAVGARRNGRRSCAHAAAKGASPTRPQHIGGTGHTGFGPKEIRCRRPTPAHNRPLVKKVRFTMLNHNIDNLDAAIDLAADLGLEFCPGCLAADMSPSGAATEPPCDSGDLEPVAVAMLELLLGEVAYMNRVHAVSGNDHLEATASRVAALARLTLAVLPPVLGDAFGRFTLTLDDAGHLPSRIDLLWVVAQHTTAAAAYLGEHDAGEWVDPNGVAGAVADICDSILNVIRLCQLKGRG
jgi:hypothetical protein